MECVVLYILKAKLIDALKNQGKLVSIEPDLMITLDFVEQKIDLQLKSVFIFGYYNKFSRALTQTFPFCFYCKGRGCQKCNFSGKKDFQSIQELLESKLLSLFQASASKFHGAGREDGDVKMLGHGRKFVFELVGPKKRQIDLIQIEVLINQSFSDLIKISKLEFVQKSKVSEIKEDKNNKIYCALVEVSEISESGFRNLMSFLNESIEISQSTPSRSLESRTDLERKKILTLLSVKKINETTFELVLNAEAGLYVKEFISGDGGKSVPSISSLLNSPANCIQLDVSEILY